MTDEGWDGGDGILSWHETDAELHQLPLSHRASAAQEEEKEDSDPQEPSGQISSPQTRGVSSLQVGEYDREVAWKLVTFVAYM